MSQIHNFPNAIFIFEKSLFKKGHIIYLNQKLLTDQVVNLAPCLGQPGDQNYGSFFLSWACPDKMFWGQTI